MSDLNSNGVGDGVGEDLLGAVKALTVPYLGMGLQRMEGKQVGDPELAAKLIVDLVEHGHGGMRGAVRRRRARAG